MNTIEQRMESFVAHLGEVPPDARRLADFEARQHDAHWVRRLLGQGICGHVIAYTHADRWWTYCFERVSAPESLAAESAVPPSDEIELWSIEAYDSRGGSWTQTYGYDNRDGSWCRDTESIPLLGVRITTRRVL